MDGLHLPGSEGDLLRQAKHLYAVGIVQTADELEGLRLGRVVLQLRVDVDGLHFVVVPDVYAERLNAHLVGHFEHHGTEDAEGLRPLAEAPFRRATSADPGHVGYHLGMLRRHLKGVCGRKVGSDVERQHRASDGVTAQVVAVEAYGGIRPHPLEAEEIAFTRLDGRERELLAVARRPMQVAVRKLAVAIVVIPVVGDVDGVFLGPSAILGDEPCRPVAVEGQERAASLLGTLGEMHLRTAHRAARGHGDAPLFGIVDGTIEVIDHSVVLDDVTLMGKHLVVGLGRIDEVLALPVVPSHQVVAAREGVVGLVGAGGIEGGEVEHHVDVAHLHYLCVACDGPLRLMGEDRVALVAAPLLHVLRQGDADTLALEAGLGIDAPGVVVHHEGRAERLVLVPIDHRLVVCQAFPPLRVLLVVGQDRLLPRIPCMGRGGVVLRPGHADGQGGLDGFIAAARAAEVAHPGTAFVTLEGIRPAPLHVDEGRETGTLVGVPHAVAPREDTAQRAPLQEVVALGKPCLIATAVLRPASVVDDVGHVPLVAFAEDGGAVDFRIVGRRGDDQAILVGRLRLLVDLGHALLRHVTLGVGRQAAQRREEQD